MPKAPEKRVSYREQQQQQIQQLMQQHVDRQQQSDAAAEATTPDRIAKLEEDAKKFAQGLTFEFAIKSRDDRCYGLAGYGGNGSVTSCTILTVYYCNCRNLAFI